MKKGVLLASNAAAIAQAIGIGQRELDEVDAVLKEAGAEAAAAAESDNPPRILSNEPTSPYYRPDLLRVGVRIDGVERTNIAFYDANEGTYKTTGHVWGKGTIEPFWRYPTTRQQRRALERWRKKRAK